MKKPTSFMRQFAAARKEVAALRRSPWGNAMVVATLTAKPVPVSAKAIGSSNAEAGHE